LSAPLGAEDELVCPEDHIQYLKQVTGHYDPLDVLVIGYSGLDQGALALLRWGGRPIRSLTVVSDSEASAQATADRITAVVSVVPATSQPGITLIGSGFTTFTADGHLDNYIARITTIAATDE
jgi:hypothetical protein